MYAADAAYNLVSKKK